MDAVLDAISMPVEEGGPAHVQAHVQAHAQEHAQAHALAAGLAFTYASAALAACRIPGTAAHRGGGAHRGGRMARGFTWQSLRSWLSSSSRGPAAGMRRAISLPAIGEAWPAEHE